MARPAPLNKIIKDCCAPDLVPVLDDWNRYLTSEKNFSAHTLRAYRTDLAQFLNFMRKHFEKTLSLNDLASIPLRDFRSWMAQKTMDGTASSSRARSLAGVRNFFRWMDKNGVLHNPYAAQLTTPKRPAKVPRPIQEKLVFQIIGKAAENITDWVGLRDYALFSLLYGGGLRIGEALSLNVGDWPEKGRSLRLLGKGRKEREVPLLPVVRKRVEAYRDAAPLSDAPEAPLFCGLRGKRLNQGIAQKTMRDLRKNMNLPDTVTPHALRHSYATHLLGEELNIREIQELLGHASLSTTQRYTDVDHEKVMAMFKDIHPRNRKLFPRFNDVAHRQDARFLVKA